MYVAKKIRLYPTKEQEILFNKHIGCCRKIWNILLEKEIQYHNETGLFFWNNDISKTITNIFDDSNYSYFKEVSSHSLYLVGRNFNQALKQCFSKKYKKNFNFPKFKSKKNLKQSFPVRGERFYFKDEKFCHIEKIGKVKYRGKINFPFGRNKQKYYNTVISKDYKGHWILSFAIECDNQTFDSLTDKSMGIDLGIKELATVSYGENHFVYHNINKSKKIVKLERRVNYLQKELVRRNDFIGDEKYKVHSKNYYRTLKKLKYVYAKLTNIREDYIHKVTHELIFMKPERIVIEDLNVSGMLKNHHLAKSVFNAKFRFFRDCIEHKCKKYNIPFILANRFYPSSKTCSSCGYIKKDLKLKDRTFICHNCGMVLDRDINASINLMNYCE